MCGHSPGNTAGAVFNTGVIFLAASNSTVAFCERWARSTLKLETWWSDDQGVFNRLLTARGFYPVRAASSDGRLVHGPDGLVLGPLPARRFCSGHMVWMQQAGAAGECAAVHATFTEFGDAGKRWRFLEAGLWGALPARYFSEGRFLSFAPPKPPPDPRPCHNGEGLWRPGGPVPRPCGGEDASHGLGGKRPGGVPAEEARRRSVRLRANLELMRRQLHALRDALALAYVLNRTLVLPHFDCLCDRSELVDYVPSCVYPGAPPGLAFPRKCSTHFVLNIHKLQYFLEPARYAASAPWTTRKPAPPLSLRAHSFLADPRTASAITDAPQRVRVLGRPPPIDEAHWPVSRCSAPHDRTCSSVLGAGDAAFDPAAAALGAGDGEPAAPGALSLRRGATNREVLRLLDAPAVRSARLVTLDDAEGAFGGWESDFEQAAGFANLESFFLLGGDWCCSSREANVGRLYPVDPPRLRVPARGS